MTWPTPHGPGFLFSAETGYLMLAALQQILKEKTFILHPDTTWSPPGSRKKNTVKITKILGLLMGNEMRSLQHTDNYILIQCGAVVLAILNWNRASFEWSANSFSQDSGMMPNHTTLLLGCSSCFFLHDSTHNRLLRVQTPNKSRYQVKATSIHQWCSKESGWLTWSCLNCFANQQSRFRHLPTV